MAAFDIPLCRYLVGRLLLLVGTMLAFVVLSAWFSFSVQAWWTACPPPMVWLLCSSALCTCVLHLLVHSSALGFVCYICFGLRVL